MPCGATVKKNAGSTIHAGVSRNRLPISREKLASETMISPTRMSLRGWMVRVSRAESSDSAIMPIELIAKLIEYSVEVKPSISWTTKDEAETYAISAKAENALTSMYATEMRRRRSVRQLRRKARNPPEWRLDFGSDSGMSSSTPISEIRDIPAMTRKISRHWPTMRM